MKQHLHLEISSKCPLSCPLCNRVQPDNIFHPSEMSLAMLKKILATTQVYETILLCGNRGDPIYHSSFHEVLTLFNELINRPSIIIATNGSYRNDKWWEKTGLLLQKNDVVIFGIDGIGDENKKYRIGSDWPSISNAISSLRNAANCRIIWQWILFRFNQDQLHQILSYAELWKIDEIRLIKSFRNQPTDWQPTISLAEAKLRILNGNNIS